MSTILEKIQKDVVRLNRNEKALLLDDLIVQLDRDDPEPIPADILTEMERRAAGYDDKPAGFTIEEVERDLFRKR